MMNYLVEAINKNKDDIALRAIVLSAKGNVFSAGHNLKELVSMPFYFNYVLVGDWQKIYSVFPNTEIAIESQIYLLD